MIKFPKALVSTNLAPMWPTTISLSEKNLIEKYFGFIKFNTIKIEDITKTEINTDGKMTFPGWPLTYTFYIPKGSLIIEYKKNHKIRKKYIILPVPEIQKLEEFINSKNKK